MIGEDSYYLRPEVSNSDLTELWKLFLPYQHVIDLTQAYRFGNLVDAMLTETHRVDHLRLRVDDEQFTKEEWALAYNMVKAFRADDFCNLMLKQSSGQNVCRKTLDITYEDIPFSLIARCKFDLMNLPAKIGGEIKTTVATSQEQFEKLIEHFDYDRAGSWYIDIAEITRYIIIGISKKPPHKIFKVFVKPGDPLYLQGKEKYQKLSFKWFSLMEGIEL
ncbi:Putative exodeoxyribonuclease 8, PDDEXK-like domain containing protein [uncultured Caudovirales phage]|uniref:Exodeoxyribonuclease 8, PDDEXK-like domain containing protein n=1 Tax=uncultured Caudovirales phage TaxID=2100421 RepID=A0A6J5SVM4_9CAUD|nr:Putative exodeoxyribonuclease 8, PDDEXK-like domain containing protein [uncultured Caudovirales phage]